MTNRDIALVIHEGVQALDVAGPLDVFAAANDFLAPADRVTMTSAAGALDGQSRRWRSATREDVSTSIQPPHI